MARLITRMADLCRQRAAEDRFLRRYAMQAASPVAGDGEEEVGPGWYASSRELDRGLVVHESGAEGYALWLEESRRAVAVAPRGAQRSAPA